MKGISILGSTGSIGRNTLRVVEHLQGQFKVVALGAGSNVDELAAQIDQFKPELVAVRDEPAAGELASKLRDHKPEIVTGEAGLVAVATHPQAEAVVSATVGAVGFVPTLRAIEAGKRVALANK
ncbi:MAG TPA: 1-deoxy-D-xylulose-5-phosphate reductoisomerase, partial [Pyrinomonadaceae bacterium]|nr:1-deoxy-D-xylulose-5-phosphate reductoisomerase [Pyrinomonadaceae bacterium]